MRKISIAALVLLAVIACKKNEPASDTASITTQSDTAAQTSTTPAPTTSAATPESSDPCVTAHFTAEDATEAVGKPMQRDANVTSDCQYIAADQSAWTISAKDEDGTAMYDGQSAMKNAEQIPGLGDKAVWNPTFKQMTVVKGNREIFLGGAGTSKEGFVKAAQKILSKL